MKISKQVIEKIKKEAQKYFEGASGCHDWSHVQRVHDLAMHIGKKEKANKDVVEVAAYLHDIGRKEEMKSKGKNFCHAKEGAREAEKILRKYKLEKEFIFHVVHCISAHRNRTENNPQTLEAKILFDADKLDASGAIGVARDFLFAGSAGSNCLYTGNEKKLAKTNKNYSYTKEDSAILEYELNLKHIKDRVLTKTGKKIAKERHRFMEHFFNRFWQEVKGVK